jgi:hypothetical protein
MAHPYHHAISSSRKRGISWKEHFPIHDWLDSSKFTFADARHRSLLHNTTGVTLTKKIFKTIKESGKIAQEHIKEDMGKVPNISDWLPEEYWSKSLRVRPEVDPSDLTGYLIYGNKFPKEAQKKLPQIINILLSPEKAEEMGEDSPLRFFYFSACGPYICERVMGPILSEEVPIATRSVAEYFVQKIWGKIPSHQELMEKRPIEDWMWKKAKPLSKEL